MESKYWILITVILIIQLNSLCLSSTLKIFGEECDGDCDERVGLTCAESKVCLCMSPNSTIYDRSRSICVTKAGHPCRRFGTENLCVNHASCPGLNQACECDRNYFQTRNSTCAPVAKYGETCTSKKPCDKASGIECVGNKNKQSSFHCQCKYPRDQYYDPEGKNCISYAGGNCSFELPCVKNAGCSQDIFELKKGETLHGKSYYYNATVGRKCACLSGFRATESRNCLPTYQSPCGVSPASTSGSDDDANANNNVCNAEEGLKCFDSKICLCQNPLHQLYNLEIHKCQHLVGSRCQESGGQQSGCVLNSECNNEGRCNCLSGFSTTPGRQCLKSDGEACSGSGQCNFYRGLTCQLGTCGCFDDFLVYDEVQQRCLGLEGSPCGEFYLQTSNSEYPNFDGSGGLDFKEVGCVSKGLNVTMINCQSEFRCESFMGHRQCVK